MEPKKEATSSTARSVVRVQVDDDRNVVACFVDDEPLPHSIETAPPRIDRPRGVVREFCAQLSKNRGSYDADTNELRRALARCGGGKTLASVPWYCARVPPGSVHADCVAYVLPASVRPTPTSFFPINWRYASGITMIEIEPVLDASSAKMLTTEYFLTRQVQSAIKSFTERVRGSNSFNDLPGFVLEETKRVLAPYAHALGENDPLLKTFDPQYAAEPKLKLQSDDYVAFCVSDWANVSDETKALAGHKEAQRHYYAVIKFDLPIECIDQIKMIIYTNPNSDCWNKLIERKVFERIHSTALAVRMSLLTRAMSAIGLKPKKSNPRPVDTMSDVFDSNSISVGLDNGQEAEGVAFYSGCAPTHRADRGMVMPMGPDRSDGVLWLHGAPGEAIGGLAWKQPATVNSLPTNGQQKITKKIMDFFVSAGWSKNWGYAKIEPIVFV